MLSHNLVGIALQQLVPGAVSVARFAAVGVDGGSVAEGMANHALRFLESRFSDHSARLLTAIHAASDRAWRALELVLAGDSFWDRLKGKLAAGDMKAFRHDVRGLLAAAGIDGAYPVDYKAAAQELRAARSAGLLQPAGLTPAGMVQSIGVFGRFDNPAELAAGQWRAAESIATELKGQGYPALAAVAGFRPGPGSLPLLGVAVRYFFRKAVEADAALAQGLSFARLESLAETQKQHFEALNRTLVERADRLEEALTELAAEVAEVKAVALDIRAEQDRLGNQNREIMEAVLKMQAKLDQVGRAAVRPQDSLSVRTEDERALVKQVIAQYRRLPAAERAKRPALRNAVGLLEVAAGDFTAAQADFAAVADSVADPIVQGAAHMNAYQAALEARDWRAALRELLAAIKCDSRRYAPFPVGKFKPVRILGAGGFGVAFLCTHKYMEAQVVVKTLGGLGRDRDYDAVFTEARAATAIQHERIVRVTDCGFTEPTAKERPFIVMDYFPGESLDEYVRKEGVLTVEDTLSLARTMADALGAAHAKRILHRDVKPGNILVASTDGELDVRVIDFGLAIQHRITGGNASTTRSAKTLIGESLAGTIEYAAPEQMGRIAGATVGPASDIYGWAKTCCFALFQTAQPTLRHWQEIPSGFAHLLSRCLEEDPDSRLQSFDDVVAELDRLDSKGEAPGASRKESGNVPRIRAEAAESPRDRVRVVRAARPLRIRSKKKRSSIGFPVWAGVLLVVGGAAMVAILLAVAMQKGPNANDRAGASGGTTSGGTGGATGGNSGTGSGAKSGGTPAPASKGTFNVPGVGSGTVPAPEPESKPKKEWPWPDSPPSARPYLPAGWKETKDLGAAFANLDYRDVKNDGSYLIGFEVGLGKVFNTDIISYLRPIWQTPTGEAFGNSYGRRPAALWTVKAKEGYALGGAAVAGGGALEGICFTFLKKSGKTLNPDDWYVTEWFGEQRRRPSQDHMRVGDGSLLVGFYGKRFADKGGINFDNSGAIGTIGFVIIVPE